MPKTVGENIVETSSTIGTSPYELEGSVLGYRSFSDAGFVTGDKPRYVVRNRLNTKYEFNRPSNGTLFTESSPDVLARGTYLSTNANAPVSWGADDLPLTIYIPDQLEVVEAEAAVDAKVSLNSYGNPADKRRLDIYCDGEGNAVVSALDDDGTEHQLAVIDRDGFIRTDGLKVVGSTFPSVVLEDESQPVDEGKWRTTIDDDGTLLVEAVDDAEVVGQAALRLLRDGTSKTTTPASPTEDSDVVPTTEWVNARIAAALAGATPVVAETGDVMFSTRASKTAGWLKMNDGTIGDALSSGTARAHADTADLFTHLWNTFSNAICPVSSGRGASAAADFAAHKTIALTKVCGRVLVAAGTGAGLSPRTPGDSFGEQSHTLTASEQASMPVTGTAAVPQDDGQAGSGYGTSGPTNVANANTNVSVTGTATGGGQPHNVIQPSYALNVFIHL